MNLYEEIIEWKVFYKLFAKLNDYETANMFLCKIHCSNYQPETKKEYLNEIWNWETLGRNNFFI